MYQSKQAVKNQIISHSKDDSFEKNFKEIKQKILKAHHAPNTSAIEQMQILEELKNFDLGKFLIENRGLNGAWTQYIVMYPQNGKLTGRGLNGKPLSKFERWLLDKCPIVMATQERFFIFQRLLQMNLKEGIRIASLPCGLMDDLLSLNYYKMKDFKLIGIDLDSDSLQLALENAVQNHLEHHTEFLNIDAWNLDMTSEFDIITSNGLNIYEPDDLKVENLYRNFYNALKQGGILISSFLDDEIESTNLNDKDLNPQIVIEDLRMQYLVFDNILNVRWNAVKRGEAQMRKMLKIIGFKNINVIYDRQGIFPTITASK